MTMSELVRPTTAPAMPTVPGTVRGAQALMLLPLGVLQLVAAIAFSISEGWHGPRDVIVALWVLVMAPTCIVVATRLGRPQRSVLTAALALLACQTGFALVKLTCYHESASLVFFGFIAVTAGLLALPASRRHFSA
jgi:hypothetical protein